MSIKYLQKKCRKWLVNKVVKLMRSTRFGDKLSGFILKMIHFNAPWNMISHIAILDKKGSYMTLYSLIIALSLYILLDGCFLSEAEYVLGAGDMNVVDPYIKLFNQEINKQTRFDFTIFGAFFAFAVSISIMHLRGFM